MGNLRIDLEEFEKVVGERIETVAVGRRRSTDDLDHDRPVRPLPRDEAMVLLDYEFGLAPGWPDRPHPVFAWTASWCLVLCDYDGPIILSWMPRHPGPCVLEFGGNYWLCGPHDWRALAASTAVDPAARPRTSRMRPKRLPGGPDVGRDVDG